MVTGSIDRNDLIARDPPTQSDNEDVRRVYPFRAIILLNLSQKVLWPPNHH